MLAESRRMKFVKYALSECVGAGVSIRFEDLEAGWEKSGLSGPGELLLCACPPTKVLTTKSGIAERGMV